MCGLTLTVLVVTIDAQWEGMGDVGSARYEPALLPPCPTIRALIMLQQLVNFQKFSTLRVNKQSVQRGCSYLVNGLSWEDIGYMISLRSGCDTYTPLLCVVL